MNTVFIDERIDKGMDGFNMRNVDIFEFYLDRMSKFMHKNVFSSVRIGG